jgi:type IV secretory pathway VirB2 component (pilin)
MNTTLFLIGLVSYGLGFLHGTSDSRIFGTILVGVIGYFIATSIYELFFEKQ